MNQKFIGLFKKERDVFNKYEEPYDKSINILFAYYTYEDYNGRAFVLFERDGKLYEVNGGHCSCYGLEEQWEPEETTIEDLKYRMTNGELGYDSYDNENYFRDELREYIKENFK